MFGDHLYQLSPKDLAGLGIDIVAVNATDVNVGTSSGSVTFIVPFDRVWIINSIVYEVTPGAAQSLEHCAVQVGVNNGGNFSYPAVSILHTHKPAMDVIAGYPAATFYSLTQEVDGVLVPSNKAIKCSANFNAAADNTVVVHLNGYSIPRGNIAF